MTYSANYVGLFSLKNLSSGNKKIKMKLLLKLFFIITAVFLVSCEMDNQSVVEDKLNDIGDNQKVLLKKIDSMDKSIKNLALANKNKPANNKKDQPPKADPNKVYNIPIGDSFSKGPDNAAVTIIEWSDFQ